MRKKKFWKLLAISLALLAVLLLLFVVAFIFNPFEGSLPDMRELVPRNVDCFARKIDLDEDFVSFPEPHFWSGLTSTRAWQQIQRGPAYRELQSGAGVESAVEQLRAAATELEDSSRGFASLVGDVLGKEVILAGRFVPPSLERLRWIAYVRVSWKVRFFWGLLQWDSVRSGFGGQGLELVARDDGTMSVTRSGADPLFVARHLDCVMITNDEELLHDSQALASGAAEESLGGSPDYRDGVVGRIRDWEEMAGARANAIELYLRPERLFPITLWDDDWPSRRAEDINERVLASFLNLEGWRFLAGTLIFEPNSLTTLARIDLNRNMHTTFQTEFFKAEPQARSLWLDPFLSMVPEGACACAAIRMPAREFLHEMYGAIDPELREEIDRQLRNTRKYDSVGGLIDSLEDALLKRIGFVFYRAREIWRPEDNVEIFEPSPAPHVAWVFWIRPPMRHKLTELYEFLKTHWSTLGFQSAFDYSVVAGVKGGDAAREFVNPNIPGTGEIVVLLYGNFFVLSNSAVLVKDMVAARLQDRSILNTRDYEVFARELPNKLNGFVMLQGQQLAEVVEDHVAFLETSTQAADEGWMADNRPAIERQVLRDKFSGYRSIAELPAGERDRFEQEVVTAMDQEWSTVRVRFIADDVARLRQLKALMNLFSSAYLRVTLDPQSIEMTSRALVDHR